MALKCLLIFDPFVRFLHLTENNQELFQRAGVYRCKLAREWVACEAGERNEQCIVDLNKQIPHVLFKVLGVFRPPRFRVGFRGWNYSWVGGLNPGTLDYLIQLINHCLHKDKPHFSGGKVMGRTGRRVVLWLRHLIWWVKLWGWNLGPTQKYLLMSQFQLHKN